MIIQAKPAKSQQWCQVETHKVYIRSIGLTTQNPGNNYYEFILCSLVPALVGETDLSSYFLPVFPHKKPDAE